MNTPQSQLCSVLGDAVRDCLKPRIVERCRLLTPQNIIASKKSYVMYVCLSTLRIYDNPGLELAARVASARNTRLLILGLVRDDSLHMTARRASFLLEGYKDMNERIQELGASAQFAVQLTIPGKRQQAHLTLGFGAEVVIVDEAFNVEPNASIIKGLCKCGSPVVSVDSACVVPAFSFGLRKFKRAYELEKAHKAYRKKHGDALFEPFASEDALRRLTLLVEGSDNALENLHFDPVSFSCDIYTLLAETGVDHAVKRMTKTPGGAKEALKRWKSFRELGLPTYNRTRSNPMKMLQNGSARCSAYTNTGMLSPMLMYKEAFSVKGTGSSKFLNEFLTWREISYNHCLHAGGYHDSINSMPKWAQDTLRSQDDDYRDVKPLESLAKGASGLKKWDLMQKALVLSGELHNNMRMPWGKEVVRWTESPESAIKTLVYLNDHFALDGMAPPSYGGIGWTLGLFDSPKSHTPIFGTVRSKRCGSYRHDMDAFHRDIVSRMTCPEIFSVKKSTTRRPHGAKHAREATLEEQQHTKKQKT